MLPSIRLSVRTLVEYVFSSGSIDNRFRTVTTMTEGTKAHKAIQSTYAETDQQEVLIKTEGEYETLSFEVEGRCDGLIFRGDDVLTAEIKSTSRDWREIEGDTTPVRSAQAKVYAYIYAEDHGHAEM